MNCKFSQTPEKQYTKDKTVTPAGQIRKMGGETTRIQTFHKEMHIPALDSIRHLCSAVFPRSSGVSVAAWRGDGRSYGNPGGTRKAICSKVISTGNIKVNINNLIEIKFANRMLNNFHKIKYFLFYFFKFCYTHCVRACVIVGSPDITWHPSHPFCLEKVEA